MFAGPNGSGKSTLINEIQKECFIGSFINADDIERKFNTTHFIDCNEYLSIMVTQADWDNFKPIISAEDKRVSPEIVGSIRISEGVLTTKSTIDSYTASVIAEFLRYILLKCEETFSFETVMSHKSKVAFLQKARENGFKTYLYFISTKDPEININRVNIRKVKGGHGVADNKIVDRYYKSLELLSQAFLNADRAFIFDNSSDNKMQNVLIEKNGEDVDIYVDEIPEWVQFYLLDKLNTE